LRDMHWKPVYGAFGLRLKSVFQSVF
jgi:hypothetical protein